MPLEVSCCPHHPGRQGDLVGLLDDLFAHALEQGLVLVGREVLPVDEGLTNTVKLILIKNVMKM